MSTSAASAAGASDIPYFEGRRGGGGDSYLTLTRKHHRRAARGPRRLQFDSAKRHVGGEALDAVRFGDEVNNHYLRTLDNALLLVRNEYRRRAQSGLALRTQLRRPQRRQHPRSCCPVTTRVGVCQVPPPGYERGPNLDQPRLPCNVMVTHDVVFPGAYDKANQRWS